MKLEMPDKPIIMERVGLLKYEVQLSWGESDTEYLVGVLVLDTKTSTTSSNTYGIKKSDYAGKSGDEVAELFLPRIKGEITNQVLAIVEDHD